MQFHCGVFFTACGWGSFLFSVIRFSGAGEEPLLQRRCSSPAPDPTLSSSTGACRFAPSCQVFGICLGIYQKLARVQSQVFERSSKTCQLAERTLVRGASLLPAHGVYSRKFEAQPQTCQLGAGSLLHCDKPACREKFPARKLKDFPDGK